MTIRVRHFAFLAALCGAVGFSGCRGGASAPRDPRRADVDRRVREVWGATLEELPVVQVSAICPHHVNITNEFEWAFSLYHAEKFGQRVDVIWRDVGGGGSAVLRFLRNEYAGSDPAKIDIVWGGGDYIHNKMAAEGILRPMTLSDDVLANVPEWFGGLRMYDPNFYWCGSAVSGFGFLYNTSTLRWAKIDPPEQWDDLAGPECFGQICLADPMQSGSAAAAYEMIVQSAESWPAGWAKLLGILGNAKRFLDSAGAAANGPGLGEAPIATCIDFYGAARVAEAPDTLSYVSPKGQTAFNPDPIAILKHAGNPEIAQRFVDFVLSPRGQALWALKVGEPDGPIRYPLARQPIRKDVYRIYGDRMVPWMVNPYEAGTGMTLDVEMWAVRFGVLRQLVRAAAIDNLRLLQAARRRLIETDFQPDRLAEFNRLPENVDSTEKIKQLAGALRDKTQAERIVTDWQRFFRAKYRRLAQ